MGYAKGKDQKTLLPKSSTITFKFLTPSTNSQKDIFGPTPNKIPYSHASKNLIPRVTVNVKATLKNTNNSQKPQQ